jgi:hypothetical protein
MAVAVVEGVGVTVVVAGDCEVGCAAEYAETVGAEEAEEAEAVAAATDGGGTFFHALTLGTGAIVSGAEGVEAEVAGAGAEEPAESCLKRSGTPSRDESSSGSMVCVLRGPAYSSVGSSSSSSAAAAADALSSSSSESAAAAEGLAGVGAARGLRLVMGVEAGLAAIKSCQVVALREKSTCRQSTSGEQRGDGQQQGGEATLAGAWG